MPAIGVNPHLATMAITAILTPPALNTVVCYRLFGAAVNELLFGSAVFLLLLLVFVLAVVAVCLHGCCSFCKWCRAFDVVAVCCFRQILSHRGLRHYGGLQLLGASAAKAYHVQRQLLEGLPCTTSTVMPASH